MQEGIELCAPLQVKIILLIYVNQTNYVLLDLRAYMLQVSAGDADILWSEPGIAGAEFRLIADDQRDKDAKATTA